MNHPQTNHQVLARKWRPRNFEEMVGQEHVLRPLMNGLNQTRLHAAYLFTGTRGVGKTTLGRIVAKCLSCEKGITSTPCNQCENCNAINQGKFPDFYEIDAASHTKVEDIRELLSNIPYAPIRGPFKIYLIDEVHMLSNHSFNALLKTLEEPPAHVVFLFATTDPEKLPATILSRCLQFNLKALTADQIEAHLADILRKENLAFEEAALTPIASAAKGSLRDALTFLYQAIAYSDASSDKKMTATEVCALLGTIETHQLIHLLEALQQQDANKILQLTQHLSEQAADFHSLLQSLAGMIHQLTLMKIAPHTAHSAHQQLKTLSQLFSLDDMQKYYQILLSGQQDLDLSPTPKMGAEMTLLRMLAVNRIKTHKAPPTEAPLLPSAAPKDPAVLKKSSEPQARPAETHSKAVPHPKKDTATVVVAPDEQIQAIMKAFNAKLVEEKTSE